MARHLVARQTVEIVARDRRQAETLMARTSAAAPALAAALERTLEALDRPGRRLRFDRVELDLGPCDPAHWEEALTRGIERELVAQLSHRAGSIAPAAASVAPAAAADRPQAALQLLGEFARSGRLPWWAGPADDPSAAVADLAAGEPAPEAVRALLGQPGAIERLARQLPDGDLATLASLALTRRPTSRAETVAALAASIAAAARAGAADRVTAWRAALGRAMRGEADALEPAPRPSSFPSAQPPEASGPSEAPSPSPQPSVRDRSPAAGASQVPSPPATPSAAAALEDTAPPALATGLAAPPALAARLAAAARARPAWSALLRHLAGLAGTLDARAAEEGVRALGPNGSLPGPETMADLLAAFVAAGRVETSDADRWLRALGPAPAVDPHDAIALDNAGLPLIWPFLPGFFDGLRLTEDRAFRDEAARHRAVSLLHFLASGDRLAPEQQLPLPKLLAGLAPDALHEPGAPMTDAEAEAGEALLAAVLEHAPMLGRISVAGLRGSFLLRPGSLATRDGRWLLRVERRGYDVLLDRLPWPIAWARLPWMPEPLQIEW